MFEEFCEEIEKIRGAAVYGDINKGSNKPYVELAMITDENIAKATEIIEKYGYKITDEDECEGSNYPSYYIWLEKKINSIDKAFEIFRDNLDKEVKTFRKSYNSLKPIQIYNDYYIIGFYEEYYEMLMSDYVDDYLSDEEIKWLSKLQNPLSFLYEEWIYCDDAFSHNWDNMLDFIHEVYNSLEE